MSDVYLFEAGSTKTDLIYVKDGERHELSLPGFNPNRDNGLFIAAIKDFQWNNDSKIYFYGSGLGSSQNKQKLREAFSNLDEDHLVVHDDVLGAARAAFGREPGIICIMGTGGITAYYNGNEIAKRRGGYGYLINDLGGGFELGKKLISAWLNGDLSESAENQFQNASGETKTDLLQRIYPNHDLNFIADFSKFAVDSDDASVQKVIHDYFDSFIQENILPLVKEFKLHNFSVIGSVGTAYRHVIKVLAEHHEIHIDHSIKNPAQRLFDFHFQIS